MQPIRFFKLKCWWAGAGRSRPVFSWSGAEIWRQLRLRLHAKKVKKLQNTLKLGNLKKDVKKYFYFPFLYLTSLDWTKWPVLWVCFATHKIWEKKFPAAAPHHCYINSACGLSYAVHLPLQHVPNFWITGCILSLNWWINCQAKASVWSVMQCLPQFWHQHSLFEDLLRRQ